MRILYLTQFFEPEPAYKGLAFARRLRDAGHEVQVLTGFPNYPGGKVYPGYRVRFFQREILKGIPVDRVPLYPSHDRSAVGRACNYLTFAASATFYGLFRAARSDVLYVYHPPMTVGLAAVIVGFLRRRPVVIDIQDLWPDTLAATGMMSSAIILRVVDALCRFVYRRATRIVVQSPGFKSRLIERGVPTEKIDVILNWADDGDTTPKHTLDLSPYGLQGRFNILFAGTMGLAQGLDVVLDAAKRVSAVEPRVQFLLVGGGIDADRLRARITAERIENVRQMPHVRRDLVIDIQCAVDVLLVTLKSDPLFEITIPSKTQVYMAVGKPILMSAAGNAAELVAAAGAGISVPPGDAVALADAVIAMSRKSQTELSDMGRHGRAFYDREMSFSAGLTRTIDVLERARADWSGGIRHR